MEQHKRLIIKALQRYRTRIEEVGDMGWYDDPSVTVTEVARVDDTIAWVEGLDAQPQALDVPDGLPHPDWTQAPAWAQWWAVDGSGATWFEYEPIADRAGDWTVGDGWDDMGRWDGAGDIDIPLGIDWRTLKAQRPVDTAQE